MSRDVEYTDTFKSTRKKAVKWADREMKEIQQVGFTLDGKPGPVIYRVSQTHGFVCVAVAGGQTVVFGDRGPVGFKRMLGPHPRVQGKDECESYFLRHMSRSERHECFYVQDAIDHCKEMSDPIFSGKEYAPCWAEVLQNVLDNRQEMSLDLWGQFLENEGIELCDNGGIPMNPDFDAVYCAQVCVQVERWLYLEEEAQG